MKSTLIRTASVRPLTGALTQPFKIASGGHDRLDNVLLSLELADATKGYGEAAPATHITGETPGETLENLQQAASFLQGRDACDYLAMSQELRARFSRNPCLIAAVEMALLDCVTRHLGMPLWRLFGPKCHPVRTDMTVVLGTVEEARKSAEYIRRKGIRAFKVKIGRDLGLDIERVQAVAQVGPKLPIYCDANEGYTERQAFEFLAELKKARIKISFFEQPVSRHDWDGLKKLSRESGVCIGADESISCLSDVVRAIREKAVNAINIKLMKFGLFAGREMATLCQAAGLKLMIGGMMETSLAMICSAHFAGGLGGFDFVDLDTPFFVKDKVMHGNALSPEGEYRLNLIRKGIGVTPA